MVHFLQPNPLLTKSPSPEGKFFRLTPLLAALLLVYPAMQARYAQAEEAPANNNLPELGRPNERPGTLTPNPNGVTLDNRFDGKRLVISPEYSDQTGLSLGGIFAFPLGESAAGGLLLTAGNKKKELLFNAGFQMDDAQRLVLTLGQQRQHLDISFVTGSENTEMTQNSGAVSYQRHLGKGLLNSFEVNGYLVDTPSRDLADKSYAVDTAALYELWNDPRRVAGGRVTGLQGRLAFTPLPGGTLRLGLGGERLEYDYLTGKQSTTRATGSAEWTQQLAGDSQIKAGADAAAAQNRYTLGLEWPFGGSGQLGVNLVGIRGRDGAPDDNQIKLIWSYAFDRRRSASGPGSTTSGSSSAAPAWGSLLDQVAKHPASLPSQVVARLDTTAAPVRLIAVNKAALPAGASVNAATGAITTPLGVVVTGIADVTLNGAPFANSGQFGLAGNNLVIDPGKITQPAVGVIDTYVVTIDNSGGGTTLATVRISHGSVKIDSITLANGDTTAPATTVAPAVSGTTDTATTLSATLNENGTGYYLVQAAVATAPSVATVQAGTSFAMTANVAATPAISGLAALTAYKIYFVAKDAANNVQVAVQSVNVTTTAAPDVTAPVATTDSTTTLFNTAKTGIDVLANDTDNSGVAPTLTGVLANPVGGTFTVNAGKINFAPASGFTGAASVTYEIKDGSNNKASGVLTVTVGADTTPPPPPSDTTPPVTTIAPAISVAATGTAASVTQTINENGTGYYLVQAAAAAAPSVAAVMAGTSFAMTAGTPAAVSLTGLTPSTGYKYYFVAKDSANNVQAAVQSVAVTTTAASDTIAPTTTAGPSVSGTSATATTLSATINEAGTGYYLVQAFAAAEPSVAAVQAGTSFAMTANVAATPAISGLTASTAYTVYFVAKDAANNVQAAVQSVAVTTTATPDVTAPTTSAGPSVSGTTDIATTLSATINEAGTGYYLVQAFAAAAPTVAAVQAGTSFAMSANVAATPAISGLTASTAYTVYFVAKDAANNVQAAVQSVAVTTTATPDVTAPTTSAGPSVSGTTDIATTLSATINENGTGYYLVQAFAAAAPSVAAVQAGTSFAMTANVAATPAIGGLTASTAYKIYFVAKDAANNVQAAVQSVAVTTTTTPDVTAPTTSAGPSVSGTTDTATTLSATINENGTGYYLVQAFAAAAPSVAAVQAGTSFAMTANVTATPAIGGLTTLTAYKIYFVAKDAANNVQAAVQSVAVTTPDTIPPATPATLSLTGNAGASAGYTNTQTLSLAVADVADPSGVSWFVSESGSAPVVGDAGWSGTKPTSFTLSAVDGLKGVYVYVKDNVGNVQATGKTAAIVLDATLPTITGLPSWVGGVASGSTTAKAVTFGDTAGGSPKAISITADSGASITGFTGAYGARSFNLVAPAGPATVTITYSVTDNAGNVTTTTQSVTVAAANTAPTAADVSLSAIAGGGVIITHDLAANISDAQDATASLTIIVVTPPAHGSLVWNSNSSFTFTTTPGYTGSDSFTYKVRDTGGLESAVQTVTLTDLTN